MGKLIFRTRQHSEVSKALRDRDVVFHIQFGKHSREPGPVEAIDASEIDALILEENLAGMQQASDLVAKMHALGKPVYYVENRELFAKAEEKYATEHVKTVMARQAGVQLVAEGAAQAIEGGVKVLRNWRKLNTPTASQGKDDGKVLLRQGTRQVVSGLAALNEYRQSIGPEARRISKIVGSDRLLTRTELDSLPQDSEQIGKKAHAAEVAARNAVFAEAMERLGLKHRVIGIQLGDGHYNLSRYLRDVTLKTAMGEYRPNIRRLQPT